MKNIENTVIEELKTMTRKPISRDSEIKSLGIDSLDLVQAVTELEEKLNISISDEELLSIKKVSDIIDLINKKQAK
ncbi:phosphopantetheine-binding protein [Mycoplasma sp. 128]|uniref:phosphopantetheine-binding protein n=1 Tax=Mycoplasma sp. 3341 TaxID=3447506 RepID=UPI003F65C989